MKKDYIDVKVRIDPESGDSIYYTTHGVLNLPKGGILVDGTFTIDVARRTPNGEVTDLRKFPPFLSMSPCPYCDAVADRNHDPLRHVNPNFGTKVE